MFKAFSRFFLVVILLIAAWFIVARARAADAALRTAPILFSAEAR